LSSVEARHRLHSLPLLWGGLEKRDTETLRHVVFQCFIKCFNVLSNVQFFFWTFFYSFPNLFQSQDLLLD